jgi:hypothetical protein
MLFYDLLKSDNTQSCTNISGLNNKFEVAFVKRLRIMTALNHY